MPKYTPAVKVARTRETGATVILHGEGFDDTRTFTEGYAAEHGLYLIHPYDDLAVIAGQGMVALEMLEDDPTIDALVIPVGGGGLIAGCAITVRGLKPDVEIIGVETTAFPSMYQTLRNEPVVCGVRTMGEGIAVKTPGRLAVDIVRRHVDDIVLVEEEAIEEAVLHLLEVEKTVVEGAGAVGLAAVNTFRDRFRGRRVGLVLSGGNIDLMALSAIIQSGLARSGRLVKLTVEMRDVPGGLAETTKCLADAGADVVRCIITGCIQVFRFRPSTSHSWCRPVDETMSKKSFRRLTP